MCFDSESVFGIWCGQYTCKLRRAANEHPYCYNGYDRDVLAQLPKNICAEFPALLTHRSAISISLVKDMVSSVMHKMNFDAFQKKLYEAHGEARIESETSYNAFKATILDQDRCNAPLVAQTLDKFTHPAKMYTTAQKRNRFPSTSWFIDRFHEWSDARAEWHDRQMMMVDGEELSGDKSHKITKLVFSRMSVDDTASKSFDGVFTLFSSSKKVVGQWLVRTGSQEEIKIALRGVRGRYHMYGFRGPLLYSTDDCCHEHTLLTSVFETLRDGRVPVGLEANLPPLTLPHRPEYLRTESAVREASGELQERVNSGALRFIGLDLEYLWNQREIKVSTLQLGTAGLSLVA